MGKKRRERKRKNAKGKPELKIQTVLNQSLPAEAVAHQRRAHENQRKSKRHYAASCPFTSLSMRPERRLHNQMFHTSRITANSVTFSGCPTALIHTMIQRRQ